MPQIDAPRIVSIEGGTGSRPEIVDVASRRAGEYRLTFGCSLDSSRTPRDAREGGVSRED
jgi:hypothetical protein